MSRKEIIGSTHTIAFGVDHVTGAFAQLWINPAIEQDCALVIIDSDGIHTDEECEVELREPVIEYLGKLEKRINAFRKNNPGVRFNLSEDDVIAFGNACETFPNLQAEVYRIFGDDI